MGADPKKNPELLQMASMFRREMPPDEIDRIPKHMFGFTIEKDA